MFQDHNQKPVHYSVIIATHYNQRRSVGYRYTGRTAILPSPKLTRCRMPLITPFLPPPPDYRPERSVPSLATSLGLGTRGGDLGLDLRNIT